MPYLRLRLQLFASCTQKGDVDDESVKLVNMLEIDAISEMIFSYKSNIS